jgi:glycosyltransferase involved in cell wall biosynthesis
MPMRIGGGIKNKLLEACSMGKPIVVSPLAVEGLEIGDASNKPWIICHSKKDWIDNICRLWKSENDRSVLGHSTRNYALEKHSWLQTAEKLVKFVGDMK